MPAQQTKQTVLFVITKGNFGGAQRYVYDLATHLPTDAYRPIVAVGGAGELKNRLEEAGIETVSVTALQRDVSFLKEIRAIVTLAALIRDLRPNVLHVNSSKAGLLGGLLGRMLRVPRIIFTAHGWAFNEKRPAYQRTLFKVLHWLTVLLSHTTIAVSYTTKEQLNWPGTRRKFIVIHNGREEPEFLPRDTARTHLVEHQPRLATYYNDFWSGTIGELHPVKQHEVAIKAVGRLVADGFAIRHLIISDGQERARLEQLISESGLQHHVFLLGQIDEAARLLPAFDLFILPSRSEALPYVAIEAAMAGLPILASNVGGIPEVVTHERSALLHPAGDDACLAAHYRELYEGQHKRTDLAQAAQENSKQFTLANMITKTITCYSGDN
jgi:glycosyltransferase involved in cell wall biosynthesis